MTTTRQLTHKELRKIVGAGRKRRGLWNVHDLNHQPTTDLAINGQPVKVVIIGSDGYASFYGGVQGEKFLVNFLRSPYTVDAVPTLIGNKTEMTVLTGAQAAKVLEGWGLMGPHPLIVKLHASHAILLERIKAAEAETSQLRGTLRRVIEQLEATARAMDKIDPNGMSAEDIMKWYLATRAELSGITPLKETK